MANELLGGDIPDVVGGAQKLYFDSVDRYQSIAANLSALSEAKKRLAMAEEEHAFNKKKQNLFLDEMKMRGEGTALDLEQQKLNFKLQNKMFDDYLKGQRAGSQMAEQGLVSQAAQTAQSAQTAAGFLDAVGAKPTMTPQTLAQQAPMGSAVENVSPYEMTMNSRGQAILKPKSETRSTGWKPQTREEAVQYARDVAAAKSESASKNQSMGSAARQNKLAKDAEALITTMETTQFEQQNIDDAMGAAERLSKKLAGKGGFLGRVQVGMLNQIDPTNELLNDWQTVKSALTNAQLSFTGQTKGAISDKEMKLFERAVGNDDLMSLPRIKTALDKMRRSVDIQKRAKTRYFKSQYGEDKLNEILGTTDQTKPQPVQSSDLSGMSDEELARIAGGQ